MRPRTGEPEFPRRLVFVDVFVNVFVLVNVFLRVRVFDPACSSTCSLTPDRPTHRESTQPGAPNPR